MYLLNVFLLNKFEIVFFFNFVCKYLFLRLVKQFQFSVCSIISIILIKLRILWGKQMIFQVFGSLNKIFFNLGFKKIEVLHFLMDDLFSSNYFHRMPMNLLP